MNFSKRSENNAEFCEKKICDKFNFRETNFTFHLKLLLLYYYVSHKFRLPRDILTSSS